MYLNSYVFEKLAKQNQVELDRKSRTAWMWIEPVNKLGILQQLTGSWTRKKAVVSEAVNEVCCGCCVVTS